MNFIYVDGGTHKNRICMVDPQKDMIIVKNRGVNPTNNELEYLALLYGLEYINNEYSKKPVTVYTDSMLIANQMNGKWRITTEKLIPLYEKCMKKMRDDIKIKWISREFNRAGWKLDSLLGK